METYFERLSAMDAAFLKAEHGCVHMHVGAILICDPGELRTEHGGVALETVMDKARAMVHAEPRFRQRILKTPVVGHPVWVDDAHFNLNYHVRHTSLPRPGGERQLDRLMGRILSVRLDRDRPLWEMWLVEGLEGDQMALIMKVHHCMIDGVGGARMMARLVGAMGSDEPLPRPRPAPTPGQLLQSEVKHRAKGVRDLSARRDDLARLWQRGSAKEGAAEMMGNMLEQAVKTPFNPVGMSPHRRFDRATMDLAQIKQVKNTLGGTVNDVVLAIVSGAVHRSLARRGVTLERGKPFRALVPASVRSGAGDMGNHVGMMIAELPVDEPDARVRLERVCATTQRLKNSSDEVESTRVLSDVDDDLGLGLVAQAFELASHLRLFNVIVTNVPGPPMPLTFLGARLRELYGAVPLMGHQALGITVFSYAGAIHWGLQADWEHLPDLHEFVEDLHGSFGDLCAVAGVAQPEASAESHA